MTSEEYRVAMTNRDPFHGLPIHEPISAELFAAAQPDPTFYRIAKRTIDIVLAALILLLIFPFMVLIAIAIWIEDRGPVFYTSTRIGRFGQPFRFYKLRSMHIDADSRLQTLIHKSDADGVAFKMWVDPRATRVGRFIRKYSLDEVPQLFNVLCGTMSLVGPRPQLPKEVEHYTAEQQQRLFVKPGAFCLREISGRSHLSFEDWLRLDLEYVQTRNLWLDLTIIVRVVPAIIFAHGAC
jgi:lipopolysaccharide/colanic/teichoic acid biosynthesis glycosyltransferase